MIVTIHQPSSQLWHLFDDTLVLAQGGRQLYFGKARDVTGWWEAKGQQCPEGWNPADCASVAERRLVERLLTFSRVPPTVLLDLATSPPPDFVPLRPALTARKSSFAPTDSDDVHTAAPLPYRRRSSAVPAMLLRNGNAHEGVDRRPQTTALTQLEVLAKREAKNLVRDKGCWCVSSGIHLRFDPR